MGDTLVQKKGPNLGIPSLVEGRPNLTCFRASFFPFCPFVGHPFSSPFSRRLSTLFSPSKSALFCRAKGTAPSLESGSLRMDLSKDFRKEIPSRNLRKKRSEIACDNCFDSIRLPVRCWCQYGVGVHRGAAAWRCRPGRHVKVVTLCLLTRCLSLPNNQKKRRRNPNPNFFVRISSVGVGVFHVKGWGAKKFGMSFETQGNQTSWRDISGFLPGITRGCPKSVRKKLCSIFVP